MRHDFPGDRNAGVGFDGGRQAPGVDRADDRLAPESAGTGREKLGLGHGGGVERHLVGSGTQDVAHFVDGAHAAADSERHECPARRSPDDIEDRAPSLAGGRYVEEDDLVCALAGVAFGQLGRIALVGEVDESGSLHDAAVGDVEAGNHATGEHHGTSSARAPPPPVAVASATSRRKLTRSRWPTSADFSGWNCSP